MAFSSTEGVSIDKGGLFDEIFGLNHTRQKNWETKVAKDAASAQQKQINDKNSANYNRDIAASNMADSLKKTAGARAQGGPILNWKTPGTADVTDFLGL